MLRNKYKFIRNHGLLPEMANKVYRSPVTSVAILGKNEGREYEMCLNPNNDKMVIFFNDREYLHRECSHVTNNEH